MVAGKRTDILAVSSSGGHWQQLQLIMEAFPNYNTVYVTTNSQLLRQADIKDGAVVNDCNRDRPIETAKAVLQCARIVLKRRPRIVISTGAAPGIICIFLGRLIGAHTIWIDSFANVERLSMSGRMAGRIANVWLTQWQHLATPSGPTYVGELL